MGRAYPTGVRASRATLGPFAFMEGYKWFTLPLIILIYLP
jgi:hypothetical protein